MTASLSLTRQSVLLGFLLLVAAAALGGCETTGSGSLAAVTAPDPPMTHVRAAEECWMSTEGPDARMDLDKRADIVDKCIAEKMGSKTADVKADVKTAAKPKDKSKDKTKGKTAAKPATKPAAKPGAKTEAGAAAKPDSKP